MALAKLTGPRILAVTCALVALLPVTRAHASASQESIFQDDRVLTFEGGVVQGHALDALQSLGVNTIHTVVNWRRLAPSPGSKKPPRGFKGANPASYAIFDWAPLDDLVEGATARGMTVLMSPAGPIPRWASRCKRNTNNDCSPNPKLYADFVAALGTRYSGRYPDPRRPGVIIPRDSRWSIWNEPNLTSWLSPQSSGRTRVGPVIYRSLVYAGVAALKRTGHARDQILAGETAPIGSGKNTSPVQFWQTLLCVGSNGRRLHGGAAKAAGCSKRKPLPVNGVSHHPYTRGAGKPLLSKQASGSITIGYLSRLNRVLAQGARNHMIRKRPPIYLTEFGVTSTPPARKLGVPISLQGAYLNQYEYLAYLNRSVAGVSQFQLEDDTGLAGKGTFQTGLLFGDGTPKPTIDAYRTPLYVLSAGRKVIVFGGARGAGALPIFIQNRRSQSEPFQTVTRATANARGYIYLKLPSRPGTWRIAWSRGGYAYFSRETRVAKPGKSPPASPPIYDFAPLLLPTSGGAPPPANPPPPPGGPLATSPPTGSGGAGTPPPPPPKVGLQVNFDRQVLPGGTSAGGTVTISPAGINCTSTCSANFTPGTAVTLTAQADQTSFFEGWSGGGCSGTGDCHVTLNQATTVTAQFGFTPPPP